MTTLVEVDELALLALTEVYLDLLARLAAITGQAVRDVFLSLEKLDRANIAEFVDGAGPLLAGARAEAIDLTAAYLSESTGSRSEVIDLRETAPEFEQPFLRTWHNLTTGQPWEQAREGGASQADALGNDYTRQGGADRMAQPGVDVRGYRRVLTPTACEWCQVVSTQLYRSAESARFGHHDCKCTVIAVPFGFDTGAALNKERLAALKKSGAVARVSAARKRSRVLA